MCSTPKLSTPSTNVETIATPTQADANVTKAGSTQRAKAAANSGRDIRTSSKGINEEAKTSKKKLLGE